MFVPMKAEMDQQQNQKIPRRNFFRILFGSVIGLAGLTTIPFIVSSFNPRKVIQNRRIPIGKPSDYPMNQMTFLSPHKLYILRDHAGMAAISAICTHLGCVVDKEDTGFICPCHGSSYKPDGQVVTGPAPRNLPWYQVLSMPDETLIVDMDRKVSPETRLMV